MLTILYFIFVQIPTDANKPGDSGKVDFSDNFDLIVFGFVPLILIILLLLYKRQKRKDREK